MLDQPAKSSFEIREFEISILSPEDGARLDAPSTKVSGVITFSGRSAGLDLVVVLDSSGSLGASGRTFRDAGVRALFASLPELANVRLGLVDFDHVAAVVQPLTSDRAALSQKLSQIDAIGGTDIAAGIREGLLELSRNGASGSEKAIILFSDGGSDPSAALAATDGRIPIHALYLGDQDSNGARLMEEIARKSNGVFRRVDDASRLPEFFRTIANPANIDRIELTSDAALGQVFLADYAATAWSAARIPLRPRGAGLTTIIATVFTKESPPLLATDTIQVGIPFPTAFVTDVRAEEGNTTRRDLIFEVELSDPSEELVLLSWATEDGTATSGVDYEGGSGTIGFLPGVQARELRIPVFGDTELEPHETFHVVLGNPVGAVLGRAEALGTIENDDTMTLLPPVISPVADLVIAEDSAAGPLRFQLSDESTAAEALEVSVSLSNPMLFTPSAATVLGSGPERSLRLEPAPDQFGVSEFVIVVRDRDGLESRGSFQVTVTPVNDPPTLDPIPDLSLGEGSPGQAVGLSGITSGALNEEDLLEVRATSSNPSVIAHPAIEYRSPQQTAQLRLAPVPGGSGSSEITVRVHDGGAVNSEVVRRFTVVVEPSPPAPALSVRLLSPRHRSIFPADPQIRLEAEVASQAQVQAVEFFSAEGLIGRGEWVSGSRYGLDWQEVKSGEHFLRAKAIGLEGSQAWSEEVAVSVAPSCLGQVALMSQGLEEPLREWMLDRIFELGLESVLLEGKDLRDPARTLEETLQGVQLILWVQPRAHRGLSLQELGFLQAAAAQGKALYFAGHDLPGAAQELGQEDRQAWRELIHLEESPERGSSSERVLLTDLTHPIIAGGALGEVQDFDPQEPVLGARQLGLEGERVLALSAEADVFVAYEDPQTSRRSLAQNLGLEASPEAETLKVFVNGVWWLACGSGCGTLDLSLSLESAPQELPPSKAVSYELVVRHAGECDGRLVQVRYQLPAAMRLVEARTERGSIEVADGVVLVSIGRMLSASENRIHITLEPLVSGRFQNVFTLHSANESTWALENNRLELGMQSEEATLAIGRSPLGPLRLVLRARPGSSYRIEQSQDLAKANGWSFLTTLELSSAEETAELPIDASVQQQFFRAVEE
jgi:hypothetical protein